ncbi:tRNA 2-thiouridine(34) synthase MnmA [Enorma phocaeensis]|uniref:tRNA-specific 2-thiouridylase MnmA n=1 Tax=Enorma phocaeensis TaxID=1871019 RepID=A0ABT7VAJ4_9ACTN|nr:tRNA 2-thiouridine(34) synthase MnmA [Enorma phocaeensis]MDM8275525.1 tRNA 2-thiouridine(34) synthase MnmA [Enorma phocaeensis]
MPRRRVLVAMSGGVDSSVAAWLLQQEGYECIGTTMRLYDAEGAVSGATPSSVPAKAQEACGNLRDIADAKEVCRRLGIPHHVLDCRERFRSDVIDEFVTFYEHGLTPNPCTICNRRIKFGLLLEHARSMGCDAVATGHYARVKRREGAGAAPVFELAKAADGSKDQSYFLYSLTQDVLAHVIFPLGGLTKEGDVRRIAEQQGFSCARKRDSQGICFVPNNDFASFIERLRGEELPSGQVLDTSGNVLGKHRGAVRYTVGQRKGLGIAAARPLYVTATDTAANTVTLGEERDLFASALVAGDWVWSAPGPEMEARLDAARQDTPFEATAQIRYHQPNQAVRISRADEPAADDAHGSPIRRTAGCPEHGAECIRIDFKQPQRAIAPGQAVVVFQDDVVLGGGTVIRVPRD